MRKAGKLFLLLFALCVLLTVSAFASGEPSAEPSGEPAPVPAEEQAAPELTEFDVTFLVNGEEYRSASVGIAVDGNEYTFQISGLLQLLGVELTYDEETDVASLAPVEGGFMAALLAQAAKGEPAASEEPYASEEPAGPEEAASGEIGASREPEAPAEPAASGEPGAEPSVAAAPAVRSSMADIRKKPVGDFFRSMR